MNLKSMIFVVALFCVGFMATPQAEAQLFRRAQSFSRYTLQRQYRPVTTSALKSTPRPVTGYGGNLHRNFVIRQEQQRFAKTGQQPNYRGNIYWAR